MIGYKVINKIDNELFSATHIGIETQYKIGKWIKRKQKQGGFAIFNNKINAKNFLEINTVYHHIYKCKYVKSKIQKLYFYNIWNEKIINWVINKLPVGTIVADKVMLLKEVV